MERPKLIILCGIPGSGKTCYAERYVKDNWNVIHLSSDAIRKELWGDEATQGDNSQVFSLMQYRTIEALNDGKSVVYDATNVTRKDRSYIINLCPKFVHIECHVIWAPIETCIKRDADRERTVGKEVIDRMLKRFQSPFYDEGIDEVKVVWPDGFNSEKHFPNLLTQMKIPHDNPHHTLDIYDHCFAAFHHAAANTNNNNVHMAAYFHDVGKPYCKSFVDSKGKQCAHAHYYSHQCTGAWQAYGIADTNVREYNIVEIAWLIGVHMDPFFNTKYYRNLPPYLKKYVDILHEADLAAH